MSAVSECDILHARLREAERHEKAGWAYARTLEAQLAAANTRAEAAEAKLAAVPLEAMRVCFSREASSRVEWEAASADVLAYIDARAVQP